VKIMGCCDNVKITSTEHNFMSEGFKYLVNLVHCKNCGSIKATTHVKQC
jgi:hypothetical protein